MNVLFVVQRYGEEVLGGSETATRLFAERLVLRGHSVTVISSCALSYDGWANVFDPGFSELNGVNLIRFPVQGPRNPETFEPLHRRVLSNSQPMLFEQQIWSRRIGPDLVGFETWIHRHAADFDVAIFKAYLYSTATRGILAAFGRVPILFHPEAHPEEMLNLSLHDGVFRLVDAFQFNTPEERALVRNRFLVQQPDVVVGIGTSKDQFSYRSASALREFELAPGNYAVVVGRVGPGKGTSDILINFQEFLQTNPNFKLVFIGESSGISQSTPNVIGTGFVTEEIKRELIGNSKVLIHGSLMESFSIVLTEAWALGIPVLVQGRSSVLRGQVSRSGGGLTYLDRSEFVDQLRLLTTDEELATSLGLKGQEYVARHYDWSNVMLRLESAIELARSEYSARHRKEPRLNLA